MNLLPIMLLWFFSKGGKGGGAPSWPSASAPPPHGPPAHPQAPPVPPVPPAPPEHHPSPPNPPAPVHASDHGTPLESLHHDPAAHASTATAAPQPADLSAEQAAQWVYAESRKPGFRWGTKRAPNPALARAQGAMGLPADGIYGPQTRTRGKAILGRTFPARVSGEPYIP